MMLNRKINFQLKCAILKNSFSMANDPILFNKQTLSNLGSWCVDQFINRFLNLAKYSLLPSKYH